MPQTVFPQITCHVRVTRVRNMSLLMKHALSHNHRAVSHSSRNDFCKRYAKSTSDWAGEHGACDLHCTMMCRLCCGLLVSSKGGFGHRLPMKVPRYCWFLDRKKIVMSFFLLDLAVKTLVLEGFSCQGRQDAKSFTSCLQETLGKHQRRHTEGEAE